MIGKGLVWLGRITLVSTMIAAGGHTLYYLYYWEWQRAQIAGTLFVATLVVGATSLLLSRMRRLEREVVRRLAPASDGLAAQLASGGSVPAAIRDGDGSSRPDFPWLAPEFTPRRYDVLAVPAVLATMLAWVTPRSDVAVFIPVLLGAGLIVSLVAALAERTAAAVNIGTTPSGTVRGLVLAGVAAVAMVGAVIAGLWWFAHYRPVTLGEGRTEITVQVTANTAVRPAEETVEIVGRYCARKAIDGVRVRRVEPAAPGIAVLIVEPLLDEQAQRRYGGCLQDANLERHRLTVTETLLVPGGYQP